MDGITRAAVDDDMEGDGMQCSDHPQRSNASGSGICAICLQEKLGKLVSSSSTSFFIGSSSSLSPSFRSDSSGAGGSLSLSLALRPGVVASSSSSSNGHCHQDSGLCSTTKTTHIRRAHMPFLLTHKKKKKLLPAHHNHHSSLVLKRSKSTATPLRRGGNPYLTSDDGEYYHKRGGFWSFLYFNKPKSEKPSPYAAPALAASTAVTTVDSAAVRVLSSVSSSKQNGVAPVASGASSLTSGSKRVEYVVVVDENADSPNSSSSNATSFGRKVSRSRSVGCGSRSFSGDFFERISTGFGDCTLRRVESQREGKRSSTSSVRGGAADVVKERVRCGGIFRGFMMASSSSYSSSSSFRLSSSTAAEEANGKGSTAAAAVHGRSKSWGWALASPMRVFGKPASSTKGGKTASESNPTPNLAANPSLLIARG